MTRISIIIPAYNSEEFISQCLESVVNQTLQDIEIIVVNDGSTDSTEKIIDSFLVKYPSKMIKINQANSGINLARTAGLKLAKGEFILFMDSDDWLELTTCETVYKHAIETASDLVEFSFKYHYENEFILSKTNLSLERKFNYPNKILDPDFIELKLDVFWNKLIKRSLLIDNNVPFYEGKHYEDNATVPLILALAKNYSYIDFYGYNYRKHNTAYTIKTRGRESVHCFLNQQFLFDELKKRNLLEKHNLYFFKSSFTFIFIFDELINIKTYKAKKNYLRLADDFYKNFFKNCGKFDFSKVKVQFVFIILLRLKLYSQIILLRKLYEIIPNSRIFWFLDRFNKN